MGGVKKKQGEEPRKPRQKLPRGRGTRRMRTPDEAEAHLDWLTNLMLTGMPASQVVVAASRPPDVDKNGRPTGGLGLGRRRAADLVREIRMRWKQQLLETDPTLERAEQMQRLRSHIAHARGQGKLQALSALEATFARVAGTEAPKQVRVDASVTIRESLVAVIGTMTEAEIEGELRELEELEERARVRPLPATNGKANGVAH